MTAPRDTYKTGLHILICCHDRVQAGMLEQLARRAGHLPTGTASDSCAAVLSEQLPDCLLVLHSPPDLDGTVAVRNLNNKPGCPLIMASDMWNPKLAKAALSAGYDAFLSIPATAEVLNLALLQAEAHHFHRRHLDSQVAELEQRLEERKLIEKAKGLVMACRQLSEEEAFRSMRTESMRRRISMARLAEELIGARGRGAGTR